MIELFFCDLDLENLDPLVVFTFFVLDLDFDSDGDLDDLDLVLLTLDGLFTIFVEGYFEIEYLLFLFLSSD